MSSAIRSGDTLQGHKVQSSCREGSRGGRGIRGHGVTVLEWEQLLYSQLAEPQPRLHSR